jgi:predicted AAA+ superfamily ATPase
MFSDIAGFVSMENPENRLRAKDDPNDYLVNHKTPLIIDEFQYVPELMPYIKEIIDNKRRPGMYFLTGSQHFSVMKNLSESLAGRIALMTLLPFSHSEAIERISGTWEEWFSNLTESSVEPAEMDRGQRIITGFYPEIVSNPLVDRSIWFNSYIQTYLERDLKSLYDIGNLDAFYQFYHIQTAALFKEYR